MAKKASIAVQMLQWKSSSRMVVAGSHSAPRRFPCPCKPSACADPAETGESVGRSSAPSCAPGAPAVLRELHLPMSPMWCSPAERRGPGMHRETPSSGAAHQHAKHKRKNQATPRNGHSFPWIFWKAESAAGPQLPKQDLSHSSGFFPSVHAPEHFVDEAASEP